jgi:hypothetical protein
MPLCKTNRPILVVGICATKASASSRAARTRVVITPGSNGSAVTSAPFRSGIVGIPPNFGNQSLRINGDITYANSLASHSQIRLGEPKRKFAAQIFVRRLGFDRLPPQKRSNDRICRTTEALWPGAGSCQRFIYCAQWIDNRSFEGEWGWKSDSATTPCLLGALFSPTTLDIRPLLHKSLRCREAEPTASTCHEGYFPDQLCDMFFLPEPSQPNAQATRLAKLVKCDRYSEYSPRISFVPASLRGPASGPYAREGEALAAVHHHPHCGAFFMENLDGTIIATALPQMARSFHVGAVNLNIGMTATCSRSPC